MARNVFPADVVVVLIVAVAVSPARESRATPTGVTSTVTTNEASCSGGAF